MERLKTLTVLFLFISPVYVYAFTGSGTEGAPYQISTVSDWQELMSKSADWNKYYILIADINLAGTSLTPVGNNIISFTGFFDGAGHIIRNVVINQLGTDYIGLFGYVGSTGQIENLGIENASVIGGNSTGCLAGSNQGRVANCYSTGSASGGRGTGGIIGDNHGSVINCYSTVSTTGNVRYIGGLVGDNRGSIANSYSTGFVSGVSKNIGGLCGYNMGYITSCHWDKETSVITHSFGGESKTSTQMMDMSTYIGWNNGNWKIAQGNDYPRLSWESVSGSAINTDYPTATYSGVGSMASPYVLRNADDILCMSTRVPDWEGYFVLANEINMSGFLYVPPSAFSGVFDGGGYEISNLIIDCQIIGNSANIGFIGRSDGQINNLGIVNVSVIGGLDSDSLAGLCGSNYGTINNCYSTGSVTGNDSLGGLCGYNHWLASIQNCYSSCKVTGHEYSNRVGGLCGYNFSYSFNDNITECYSDGSVSGGWYVGGLCGYNYADRILNCYSSASVQGFSRVGGLVGDNVYGQVANSYSDGSVSGDEKIGGLIGNSENGTAENSFWNIETSGANNSSGGIGKTTVEMSNIQTYLDAGWDFIDETTNGTEDIWYVPDGEFPQLTWEITNSFSLDGLGTQNDPFLINSFEDFEIFRNDPKYWAEGIHTRLDTDIDLDPSLPGRMVYSSAVIAPDTNNNSLGYYTFEGTAFSGMFHGNGHKILGLTTNGGTSVDHVGLFGAIGSGGKVENLGVDNCQISGDWCVAALVARNNGTVQSCYSTGTVTGRNMFVGGLVGTGGSVLYSYSNAFVTGNNWWTGGLVGEGGRITHCYFSGQLVVNDVVADHSGALVGETDIDRISSSYFLNTSGRNNGLGFPLTDPEMKVQSNFIGWDFINESANGIEDIWQMPVGDYPKLAWEVIDSGIHLDGEYWFGEISVDITTNVPWGKRGTVSISGNQWDQEWDDNDGHHTFSSSFTTTALPDGSINIIFLSKTVNVVWNGNAMIHTDTAPNENNRMGIDLIVRKATGLQSSDVVGEYSNFGHRLGWNSRWDEAGWGDIVFNSDGTAPWNMTYDDGHSENGTLNWALYTTEPMINVVDNNPAMVGEGGVLFVTDPIPDNGDDFGLNFFVKKTTQAITPADIADTYLIRFLETGLGGVPYTCGQGTCIIREDGTLTVDAYYSNGEHDVFNANYTIGPGNSFYIDGEMEGIISPNKDLIFLPEYKYENPPTRTEYDWLGGIFLVRTPSLNNGSISDHVFEIEMSLSHDYGEGYSHSTPVDYQFDAWMRVDDTVATGNIQTPNGSIYTAEFNYENDETWLGVYRMSTSLTGLSDFIDGDYIFTIIYTNGSSDSTIIPFKAEDGNPLTVPPLPVMIYPVHGTTNVPQNISFGLDPSNMTNPVWTYGIEYFPTSGSGLEGEYENLSNTTTIAGPVALSPDTEYEVELTANHAVWSTNDNGIPYVVDKDSEVEILFTTNSSTSVNKLYWQIVKLNDPIIAEGHMISIRIDVPGTKACSLKSPNMTEYSFAEWYPGMEHWNWLSDVLSTTELQQESLGTWEMKLVHNDDQESIYNFTISGSLTDTDFLPIPQITNPAQGASGINPENFTLTWDTNGAQNGAHDLWVETGGSGFFYFSSDIDLSATTWAPGLLVNGDAYAKVGYVLFKPGMMNFPAWVSGPAINWTNMFVALVSGDKNYFVVGNSPVLMPDLTPVSMEAPDYIYAGSSITVDCTTMNKGMLTADSPWIDGIYLSNDEEFGNDLELVSLEHVDSLDPNESYQQTFQVTIPANTSESIYRLIVKTDDMEAVEELSEDNNILSRPIEVRHAPVIAPIADQEISELVPYISSQPTLLQGTQPVVWSLVNSLNPNIVIDPNTGIVTWDDPVAALEPYTMTIRATNAGGSDDETWQLSVPISYTANVTADPNLAPSGTPILLSGEATLLSNGQPVPDVDVTVRIRVKGTRRVIDAHTDEQGLFSVLWQPLANEAGLYSISADHPLVPEDTVQDEFVLVGMRTDPKQKNHRVYGGSTISDCITIENLGDTELTGLTAAVSDVPDYLVVTVTDIPEGIDPSGSVEMCYTIEALENNITEDMITIQLESAEGSVTSVDLMVKVSSSNPHLTASVDELTAGMVRGQQWFVEFQITNTGGWTTDEIQVQIPDAPWLSLAVPSTLPPLAPDESASVILTLSPSETQVLGPYEGSLVVFSDQTGVEVPFNFNCVSDGIGDLEVTVVDEFTYFAEGNPKVENATVTLYNPYTDEELISQVTDLSGVVLFEDITEAYYKIKITASEHKSFSGTTFIPAGQKTTVKAFLSRQLVTYNWNVIPTTIEDRYDITIDVTFETNVPAPVVTVDPVVVDIRQMEELTMQVDYTFTNHGLVTANGFEFVCGTYGGYKFTPLVETVGDIPPLSSVVIPVIIENTNIQSDTNTQYSMSALQTNKIAASSPSSGPYSGPGPFGLYYIMCGGKIQFRLPTHIRGYDNTAPNNGGVIYSYRSVTGQDSSNTSSPADDTDDGEEIWLPDGVQGPIVTGGGGNICDNDCFWKGADCFVGIVGEFIPPLGFADSFYRCLSSIMVKDPDYIARCLINVLEVWDLSSPWVTAIYCREFSVDCLGSQNASPTKSDAESLQKQIQSSSDSPGTDMSDIEEHLRRINSIIEPFIELFGDPIWLNGTPDDETDSAFNEVFAAFAGIDSNSSFWIDTDEQNSLRTMGLPAQITSEDVDNLIERWNRTMDYWHAGVYTVDDVPQGQSTDFIDYDRLLNKLELASIAEQQNISEGYTYPFDGINHALLELYNQMEQENGICARVKIRINQTAILTRDAFTAILELNNEGDIYPLEEVDVDVEIWNENGNIADDLFGIFSPELSGISDVNGLGVLPPGQSARAEWLIVPTNDAAPEEPKLYYVTGKISYASGGKYVTIPLIPTPIMVHPNPELQIKYFLERDVYSDDPFTEEIEPAVPFSLGFMATNSGFGIAKDVSISSSQPVIVDNEKGLFIDFEIIGSRVGAEWTSPSLTVNFDDIDPNKTVVAQWLMTSSLQGEFIDYKATYTHVTGLGDLRLSLIDSLDIFETEHVVRAEYPVDDMLPDFLTNQTPDIDDLPDHVHLSDGTVEPVTVVTEAFVDGIIGFNDLEVELTVSAMPQDWTYIRVPDPGDNTFQLVSVIQDETVIRVPDNAWTTHRTIRKEGQLPHEENFLHLLDFGGPGIYTLVYAYEDIEEPVAQELIVDNIAAFGAAYQEFTVVYNDNAVVDVQSLDSQDILVTGPNGYSQLAELISVDAVNNTSPVSATYRIIATGGQWDFSDNGVYLISIVPEQVYDSSGNSIPFGVIGSFDIYIEIKSGIELITFNQVNKRRIGRTEFEYDFTVTLKNLNSQTMHSIMFEITGLPENIIASDNSVYFEEITGGSTATSGDTLTLTIDRAIDFNESQIIWDIMPYMPSDYTLNGRVDMEDFAILTSFWLTANSIVDVAPEPDGDGIVDILDLMMMAEQWLDNVFRN